VFGVNVWLSIVLAILVTGIVMTAWEGYLRTKDPT